MSLLHLPHYIIVINMIYSTLQILPTFELILIISILKESSRTTGCKMLFHIKLS